MMSNSNRNSTMDVAKRCRLCFGRKPGKLNIFVEDKKSKYAVEIIKMFQIQMVDTPALPGTCCPDCSGFMREIFNFKEKVQKIQISLTKMMEMIALGISSESPEVDTTCRLCSSDSPGLANIFQDSAHGQKYSFHIQDLLKIELRQSPIMPQTCCSDCLQLIEKIRTFRIGIIKTHASFMNALEPKKEKLDNAPSTSSSRSKTIRPPETCGITENDHSIGDTNRNVQSDERSVEKDEAASLTEETSTGFLHDDDDDNDNDDDQRADNFNDDEEGFDNNSIHFTDEVAAEVIVRETREDPPKPRKKLKPRKLLTFEELKQYREEEQILEKIMLDMGVLTCNECQFAAASFRDLFVHAKKLHNKVAGIVCCNMYHKGHTISFDHIRCHLNPDAFKCTVCGKQCHGRMNLNQHMNYVHSGRDQQCDICGKSFVNIHVLNVHKRSHAPVEERKYNCSYCPKKFSYVGLLNRHERSVHQKLEAFQCTICGLGFPRNVYLQRHIKRHEECTIKGIPMRANKNRKRIGEDPAEKDGKLRQCNLCQNYYLNLHGHMKHAHSGPSKARRSNEWTKGKICCEKCGKYITKYRYESHCKESCDEGKTIFNCETCGKVLESNTSLKRHQHSHTRSRQISCPFCPFFTSRDAYLIQHYNYKHPEEYEKLKLK